MAKRTSAPVSATNPADAKIDLGAVTPNTPGAEIKKKKANIILKNTSGEDVNQKDYFWSTKGEETAPYYFNKFCGLPVTREDMLQVFDKIFKPEHGVLFYKVENKELYLVIPPIKYAATLDESNDSKDGDFQRHALSFVADGSVNLETLKLKLARIAKNINIPS